MTPVPLARRLLRGRDLADARYFEPLGVDDMAAAAHLSRAHFSREFRRALRALMAKGFALGAPRPGSSRSRRAPRPTPRSVRTRRARRR